MSEPLSSLPHEMLSDLAAEALPCVLSILVVCNSTHKRIGGPGMIFRPMAAFAPFRQLPEREQ